MQSQLYYHLQPKLQFQLLLCFYFQFGRKGDTNASHRQLTQISLSRPILGGNQNCTPSQAEFQLGAYSRLAFYLCAGFSNCCSVAFSLVANSDFDLHSSLAVVALICCCCLRLLHELKVPLYTLSESESCVFPQAKKSYGISNTLFNSK